MFGSKGFKGIKNSLTQTLREAIHRKSAPENDENPRDSYEEQDNKENNKSNGPQSPTSPDYSVIYDKDTPHQTKHQVTKYHVTYTYINNTPHQTKYQVTYLNNTPH